jgi:FkbM family methyltransferase
MLNCTYTLTCGTNSRQVEKHDKYDPRIGDGAFSRTTPIKLYRVGSRSTGNIPSLLSAWRSRAGSFRRRKLPTAHERNVRAWVALNGDATLRLDYPLTAESTVLDIGGFEGQWASEIFERYGCRVAIFEPWPAFARQVEDRFRDNAAVTVHPFGLGATSRTQRVYGLGDSTSVFQPNPKVESQPLPIQALDETWRELGLRFVDLMKINIEGGEYELLDALISSGLIRNVRDIQVQFHKNVPNARKCRRALRVQLATSHRLTYSIPFVWENWTLLTAEDR